LQDKLHQRAALSAAGLPGPPFARVDSPDDVIRCGRRWGFPIMVKPARGAQSRGVSRVDRPEQAAAALAAAYGASGSAPGGTVLAEGFVEGQDIAVESMVLDGVTYHVSFSQSGWHGDVWCAAAPLAPHLQAALPEIGTSIAQANSAMGLRWAATSNELRLTEAGPVIIEVNARLGGGPCEDAVRWHSGIDRVRGLLTVLIGGMAAVTPAYHQGRGAFRSGASAPGRSSRRQAGSGHRSRGRARRPGWDDDRLAGVAGRPERFGCRPFVSSAGAGIADRRRNHTDLRRPLRARGWPGGHSTIGWRKYEPISQPF
jgi:biotin carboxylase